MLIFSHLVNCSIFCCHWTYQQKTISKLFLLLVVR